jgi:protein TonB
LIAAGVALVVHGYLFGMDLGWMKGKLSKKWTPEPLALTLHYLQPQKISYKPRNNASDIQKPSVPPKKETKPLEKASPTKTKEVKRTQPKKPPKKDRNINRPKKVRSRRKPKSRSQITKSPPSKPFEETQSKVTADLTASPKEPRSLPERRSPGTDDPLSGVHTARAKEEQPGAVLEHKEASLSKPALQEIREAIPIYRKNPTPRYPRTARRRGYQGTVILEVLVDREGRVGDTRLSQSSGYGVLDRAAMASVKGWSFEPGKRGDEKVDMWVMVPVRFQLK